MNESNDIPSCDIYVQWEIGLAIMSATKVVERLTERVEQYKVGHYYLAKTRAEQVQQYSGPTWDCSTFP